MTRPTAPREPFRSHGRGAPLWSPSETSCHGDSCAILQYIEDVHSGWFIFMQSIARDYWTIWKQFVLHGIAQEDVLPPALMQSWRRCAANGLDPYGEVIQEEIASQVSSDISHRMLSLVRPVMEDLHQFIEGSQCIVVFADASARIVDCFGDKEIQQELEHLGLNIGASWQEEHQGSNALSLALQESFPIQIDGAMHFRAALHPLYTSA